MAEHSTMPVSPDENHKSAKRSKSDKGERKSRKRHRDSNATEAHEGSERKHKRSKSHAAPQIDDSQHEVTETASAAATEAATVEAPKKEKSKKHSKKHAQPDSQEAISEPAESAPQDTAQPEKKKKKHRHRHAEAEVEAEAEAANAETSAPAAQQDGVAENEDAPKKKKKRERKSKNQVKAGGEAETGEAATEEPETIQDESNRASPNVERKSKKREHRVQAADSDMMDIDSIPALAAVGKLSDHQYPFYTQTVSQYLPLHPLGLIEPVHSFADQHLKPLLNHYVPNFGGVLLAYRNPRVGEAPGKGSLTEESGMDDVAVLESINEYAVTFAWLTVEVDLFRPTRGAWLEGSVNLQGEGHIGVVCWGMFNAAIEAERLPSGWRWVDILSQKKGRDRTEAENRLPTPTPADELEADESQLHTSGYWVDEKGSRIRGETKLCFRIKNYEVGVSGDYGFLSIEGTMLSEEDEKKKTLEEMEMLRRRRLRHGGVLRKEHKRLPEFSMTRFGNVDDQGDESQKSGLGKTSQPAGGST